MNSSSHVDHSEAEQHTERNQIPQRRYVIGREIPGSAAPTYLVRRAIQEGHYPTHSSKENPAKPRQFRSVGSASLQPRGGCFRAFRGGRAKKTVKPLAVLSSEKTAQLSSVDKKYPVVRSPPPGYDYNRGLFPPELKTPSTADWAARMGTSKQRDWLAGSKLPSRLGYSPFGESRRLEYLSPITETSHALGEPSQPVFDDKKVYPVAPTTKFIEIPHVIDGFFMLNHGHAEDPDSVYVLDISGRTKENGVRFPELRYVIEDDLSMFTKLHTLHAGEHRLPMARLGSLPALRRLSLPCNDIRDLDLDLDGKFPLLEVLDLSFNRLSDAALLVLGFCFPNLKSLDLTGNELHRLPQELGGTLPHAMSGCRTWRDRVIEYLMPDMVASYDRIVAKVDKKADVESKDESIEEAETLETSNEGRNAEGADEPNANERPDEPESVKYSTNGPTPGEPGPKNRTQSVESTTGQSKLSDQNSPVPFSKLECLVLEKNYLDETSLIRTLKNLPRLSVESNPLGISDSAVGFSQLEELAIAFNLIDSPTGLMGVVWLPKLSRVFLEGNPICKKGGGVISITNEEFAGNHKFSVLEERIYSLVPPNQSQPCLRSEKIPLGRDVRKGRTAHGPGSLFTFRVPNTGAANFLDDLSQKVGKIQRLNAGRLADVSPGSDSGDTVGEAPIGSHRAHFIGRILKGPAGSILHRHREEMRRHIMQKNIMEYSRVDGSNQERKKEAPLNTMRKVQDIPSDGYGTSTSLRREYRYTDDDVKNMLKMGRIPTIKELEKLAARQTSHSRQKGHKKNEFYSSDKSEFDPDHPSWREKLVEAGFIPNSTTASEFVETHPELQIPFVVESASQGNDQSFPITSFSPGEKDTFLTGVQLIESPEILNGNTPVISKSYVSDSSGWESSDEADSISSEGPSTLNDGFKLPTSIQASIRALRHALMHPVSYWRSIVGKRASYAVPTISSQNRAEQRTSVVERSSLPPILRRASAASKGGLGIHTGSKPKSKSKQKDLSDVMNEYDVRPSGLITPPNSVWSDDGLNSSIKAQPTSGVSEIEAERQNDDAKISAAYKSEGERRRVLREIESIQKVIQRLQAERDLNGSSAMLNTFAKDDAVAASEIASDHQTPDESVRFAPGRGLLNETRRSQSRTKGEEKYKQISEDGYRRKTLPNEKMVKRTESVRRGTMSELRGIMVGVDSKIEAIEANLGRVLKQKDWPIFNQDPKRLFAEVKEEYEMLEKMYFEKAREAVSRRHHTVKQANANRGNERESSGRRRSNTSKVTFYHHGSARRKSSIKAESRQATSTTTDSSLKPVPTQTGGISTALRMRRISIGNNWKSKGMEGWRMITS
ncbi:hypothetical protein BJ742DRAFT_867253 [Cladochytrium replicatum]|nr:hypothetical protein BJ742DRAFT_867253 [Cladochytrium replicatum]